MTEDNYKCKVCGDQFEEKEELTAHGKDNHPEVNEAYPEIFDKNQKAEGHEEDEYSDDMGDFTDKPKKGKYDDRPVVQGEPVGIVGEIDQQQDKPVQSHDDWVKELEGLKDEFSTEEVEKKLDMGRPWTFGRTEKGDTAIVPTRDEPEESEEGGTGSGPREGSTPSLLPEQTARAGDPHYNPFKATPPSERLQTDPALSRTTENDEEEEKLPWIVDDQEGDNTAEELIWNGEHYVKAKEQEEEEWNKANPEEKKDILDKSDTYQHNPEEKSWDELHPDVKQEIGEEEEGADAPLKKVEDLAENYRYISKDQRAKIFESIGINQGDANILAGLQWNELRRPLRVEASEAYIKEEHDVPDEEYEQEQREEAKQQEENEAYERFYNLEKNHSSPDYKKKAIECNRCNEAFYNTNDRDIHYNEVHATEDTYNLPEECPFCKIELPEGQDLDYHMSTAHGAHLPSEYTQTGVDAGMADADWDRIEYAGASYAKEKGETYIFTWRLMDLGMRENMMREVGVSTSEAGSDWEQLPYEITEPLKLKMNDLFRETGRESYAKESRANEISRPITDKEAMLMYDKPWDELTHEEKLIMHAVLADESRVKGKESRASEIKKEIKYLQGIIQVASEENPMHMYIYHNQIAELESELSSLGESKANEDYIPAPYDKHFDWVASMDQDDYVCKHCGQMMMANGNALHTQPQNIIVDVVKQHLASHGITEAREYLNPDEKLEYDDDWYDFGEDGYNSKGYNKDGFDRDGKDEYGKYEGESYAKEHDRLDSEGYPICQICGQTITGDEDILFDLTNNVKQHLLDHGKTEEEVGQIQHKMLMGGAMEAFDTDWACPRCGNKNVKIKYDKDGNPSGRECPKCGLGSESYANETLHGDTNKEGLFYWKPTNEWLEDSDWELRDIIEGHPKVEEADTRWVKGQDEKWHEIDSSDRDYEQGISEKPAEAKEYEMFPNEDLDSGDDKDEADEQEGENECEGCGRLEDVLNDEGLCEDCEREAGIDRKESERDAYD